MALLTLRLKHWVAVDLYQAVANKHPAAVVTLSAPLVREMESALRVAFGRKTLRSPRGRTDVKQQARGTKRDETTALRAAAAHRSLGFCECGCGRKFTPSDPPEMDHQAGRARVPQRIENVWLLVRSCHRSKTENKPSASYWLGRFIEHAERHGYSAEAERARNRREAISEVQQAAAISRGEHS